MNLLNKEEQEALYVMLTKLLEPKKYQQIEEDIKSRKGSQNGKLVINEKGKEALKQAHNKLKLSKESYRTEQWCMRCKEKIKSNIDNSEIRTECPFCNSKHLRIVSETLAQ